MEGGQLLGTHYVCVHIEYMFSTCICRICACVCLCVVCLYVVCMCAYLFIPGNRDVGTCLKSQTIQYCTCSCVLLGATAREVCGYFRCTQVSLGFYKTLWWVCEMLPPAFPLGKATLSDES